jgi:DMSO reductase anchor subunit
VAHLGQPLRAWRCFLGWRKSWLSREILAFGAFFAAAAAAVVTGSTASCAVAALAGLIGVHCSSMVYIDTRRPFWSAWRTMRKFYGTTLLLGASGGAAVAALTGAPAAWLAGFAVSAAVIRTLLFAGLRCEWMRDLANPRSATHASARIIARHPGLLRLGALLFWLATLTGVPGMAAVPGAVAVALLSLAFTFGSQILERHWFFKAAAAPRMPGVPAPAAHT